MNSNKILSLRRSLGWTQFQFALALGVSPGTVHRWEAGKCKPSPLAVAKLDSLAGRRHE